MASVKLIFYFSVISNEKSLKGEWEPFAKISSLFKYCTKGKKLHVNIYAGDTGVIFLPLDKEDEIFSS